ncbi:COBRA-like protein 1 [Turnera subulata]|uniref:COBRA-like protein 1 n=1 Tax=Turnera subulata TaxID=218843 RepID=A0A9Q0FAM9_9ROSI|nr:COBRA-like protein 1 [Turnera subulata]
MANILGEGIQEPCNQYLRRVRYLQVGRQLYYLPGGSVDTGQPISEPIGPLRLVIMDLETVEALLLKSIETSAAESNSKITFRKFSDMECYICVSLSSFYNNTIVPCPTCACGCQSNTSLSGGCVDPSKPHIASVVPYPWKTPIPPLVQCTRHMCPIRVHWHVKLNYRQYWRVKITITNFNYNMNYSSQWNLVVQHPNFDNLTQIFSFNFKPLTPFGVINDTAMLWGVKFYNDLLIQAGLAAGNMQSKLLFQKDQTTFTFEKG